MDKAINPVMGSAQQLVLRDIHQVPAPAWWPPAPGWWLLAAVVVLLLAGLAGWSVRRRRRQRAITALFDDTVQRAASPTQQVAAMSELLRRAARRHQPHADRLQGRDWLQLLNGNRQPPRFSGAAGRLLLEGGFQREVDVEALRKLRPLARARYLEWMAARP